MRYLLIAYVAIVAVAIHGIVGMLEEIKSNLLISKQHEIRNQLGNR